MKCKQVQKLLQSFIDNDLSESVTRQIKSHLRRCPDCAALKRDFESLTRLARAQPATAAPRAFHQLLRTRLAQGGGRGRGIRRSPGLAWSTVAALILAAFALASLRIGEKRQETPGPLSRSGVTSVILPADPGTPGTHVFVPGEQENMLVRVPSTVTITRTQLTQDFFLSEESH